MSIEIYAFHSRKCIWKCRLENGGHFVPTSTCWPHGTHQSISSGRALALTLACYASCDRATPEMHPLKIFEIWGHPHFKQLHGHQIPMNATNSPDRLNLYIFSLNLSYHSFVSVHDIQQKRLLNKISVYTFTHPCGHHRVADATLSVACTCDSCATFRSPERHQRSRESRDHHYDAQLIYRIQKSLMPGTMHFSKRPRTLLRTLWRRYWDDNGLLFAILGVSCSVQARVVARRTNGVSQEARKMTWSCTKYVADISAHRFSNWQKGNG